MSLETEIQSTLTAGAGAADLCVPAAAVSAPKVKLPSADILAKHKAGQSISAIAKDLNLNYQQVQKVIYNANKKAAAIKDVLKAPTPPVAPTVKTIVPPPAAPTTKLAVYDPSHPSKKTITQFWVDNLKYHGFKEADMIASLEAQYGKTSDLVEKTVKNVKEAMASKPVPPPVATTVPKEEWKNLQPTPAGEWPVGPDVVRKTGSRYPQQVVDAYRGWESTLTEQQKNAIRQYTGNAYIEMNDALRKSGTFTDRARRVQEALMHGTPPPPPPPDLVWRGMGSGAADWASKLSSGDVIEMLGFQSTSISPDFASNWRSGVLLEIRPARGAYVDTFSANKGEKEFILPHGAKYRVRGKQVIKLGDGERIRTVIQLEMIP